MILVGAGAMAHANGYLGGVAEGGPVTGGGALSAGPSNKKAARVADLQTHLRVAEGDAVVIEEIEPARTHGPIRLVGVAVLANRVPNAESKWPVPNSQPAKGAELRPGLHQLAVGFDYAPRVDQWSHGLIVRYRRGARHFVTRLEHGSARCRTNPLRCTPW